MTCATTDESEQTGQPLLRVFTVRTKTPERSLYPLSAQQDYGSGLVDVHGPELQCLLIKLRKT